MNVKFTLYLSTVCGRRRNRFNKTLRTFSPTKDGIWPLHAGRGGRSRSEQGVWCTFLGAASRSRSMLSHPSPLYRTVEHDRRAVTAAIEPRQRGRHTRRARNPRRPERRGGAGEAARPPVVVPHVTIVKLSARMASAIAGLITGFGVACIRTRYSSTRHLVVHDL